MTFFLTLFLILFFGVLFNRLAKLIKIPSLVFYLLFGILLSFIDSKVSNDSFHLLDTGLMNISSYIRKIALIIILLKAGLSLSVSDLKKVGRPAILMSFVPACVEMVTVGLLSPLFFPITYTESFLLGSVLGAVSPAVVIPMMSRLLEEKYGTKEGIPQLIIAGSSIDDIVMIVFYQCFLTMEKGGHVSAMTFLNIPISIVLGIGVGLLIGFLLSLVFKKAKMDTTLSFILLLAIGFGLTCLEDILAPYFGFSSLLSIITFGLVLFKKIPDFATELKNRANQVWVFAEMFLFVLVGCSIKMEYAFSYFLPALLLLLCSLTCRSLAVSVCLIKTKLNLKERAFTVLSYLPKATVQAAIGGGLLDLGNQLLSQGATNANAVIQAGEIVLSVSVLCILLTAPLSAILMNSLYPHLLKREEKTTD